MDDPVSPKISDFAPLIGWALALASTIGLTKALVAAYPSVDAVYLLLAAGLPISAIFYAWARWWSKRHA